MSLASKAVMLVPFAFAIGLFARDYVVSTQVCASLSDSKVLAGSQYAHIPPPCPHVQDEDKLVAKKVAQRMGEWSPPALSADERLALETEKSIILKEIARIEERGRKRHRQADGTA
jgi:hypothetical protein